MSQLWCRLLETGHHQPIDHDVRRSPSAWSAHRLPVEQIKGEFTDVLTVHRIQIAWVGAALCPDNIFADRWSWTMKRESAYFRPRDIQLQRSLAQCFD